MIDSKSPSRRMKSLTRHNDRQGQQVYVSLGSGKVVQKGVAMPDISLSSQLVVLFGEFGKL